MLRTHEIKLDIEFCDAVLYGDKTFEIRFNDRGYQKGDRIRFLPVKNCEPFDHKIIGHRYLITYVLCGWGLKEGYVAIGIKDEQPLPPCLR